MKLTIVILAAIVSLAMLALPDRVSVRTATGRRYARVSVIVQPRAEHRALVVSGVVVDDEGEPIWERVSSVQLDGDRSRSQHIFAWPGAAPGLLRVRAEVIGLCGSDEAVSMVGF